MRIVHDFPLALVWPDNWRDCVSLVNDGKERLHMVFTNEERSHPLSPFTLSQVRNAYQTQVVFNHRYSAESRGKRWYIMEDGTNATGPTEEASARWYAAMWSYWGSKFERQNAKCVAPLPDELNRLWLDLMTHAPHREEEDEDRVREEPQQRSLWEGRV